MSPFEHALDVAARMRDALQAELDEARTQRVMVRVLDVQGLFERARRRGEFNVRMHQLQESLATDLREAAVGMGVEQVTTEVLLASGAPVAEDLAKVLSELRASAQALQEIDNLNQMLAKRALACVRGFLSALSPRTSTYDRFGGIRIEGTGSTARQVA